MNRRKSPPPSLLDAMRDAVGARTVEQTLAKEHLHVVGGDASGGRQTGHFLEDKTGMGVDFYKGDPVWMSHPTEAWVAGTITAVDTATVSLRVRSVESSLDIGEVPAVPFTAEAEATLIKSGRDEGNPGRRGGRRASNFKCYVLPRDHRDQAALGVRNMDDMVHLHEGAVLDNLRKRFRHDLIYTSTGPILIAMNPFKRLPIYSQELMHDTCARIMRNWANPEQVGCEPHVFTTVAQSYAAMKSMALRERENQSMVICGESGAGKTETTKLMLRYLSNTASGRGEVQDGAVAGAPGIEEQILESNPLMEAFGNAKTLRNDNSSRFGKYVKVQFDETCKIVGAQITNYLLEKSRIVHQPQNERNYHIFYQLFFGCDDEWRERLALGADTDAFEYLNQSGCTQVNSIDDVDGEGLSFKETMEAMQAMNISDEEREFIFCVLGAVLHLGNLDFELDDGGDSFHGGHEGAAIPTHCLNALETTARLFSVDASRLGHVLRHRQRRVGPETVESPLKPSEAVQMRNALAKAVYDRLFSWLVNRINGTTARLNIVNGCFIGILDIYGFEDLNPNGFEQLFINYANEKLQSLFNEHIFKMEEDEYRREEINFDPQEFPDNQECLDLIDKPPRGILMLVNEQCMRGDVGSDQALASKLHRTHGPTGHGKNTVEGHSHYELAGPSTPWRGTSSNFVVRHYAGKIMYTTDGFVSKNRDTLLETIEDCMKSSKMSLLSKLFGGSGKGGSEGRRSSISGSRRGKRSGSRQQVFKRSESATPARGSRRRGGNVRGTAISMTVAKKFKDQLAALMKTMRATAPRFVRCIKSNPEKAPLLFEAPNVLRQLKYAGVMEALRVRRAGFPNRRPYRSFLLGFRLLLGTHNQLLKDLRSDSFPLDTALLKEATRRLFAHRSVRAAGITSQQYQLGTSKVFLRADVLHTLNSVLEKLQARSAIVIQNMVRTVFAYRRHQLTLISTVIMQRYVRGFLGRREHKAMLRRHTEARLRRERERIERLERERAAALERKRQEELRKIAGEAVSALADD